VRATLIHTGMNALYFSGGHFVLQPFFGGLGAIFAFRHVRPRERRDGFQPNRRMEITPRFLDRMIKWLRNSDVEIISLDEMYHRFVEANFARRFVCLTFDGGYRDVRIWAYPILRKHSVPFAVYVPTSFVDRVGEVWWRVLEDVIAKNDHVALLVGAAAQHFECRNTPDKKHVFSEIYRWLRALPDNDDIRSVIRDLASRYDVDMGKINGLCMTWQEVAELAEDPLVTLGANTVNYPVLAKASEAVARSELKQGRAVIEAAVGIRPEHLAFPYGRRSDAGAREFRLAAELGYKTAVTTRPGMLFPEHRDHLTALPRIAIDGECQKLRYVRVLTSGGATAVWNGFADLVIA
jgi:peptidoglycan/xylan/chitin deacetylase (PgdA/CDA1 family)